MNFMNTIDTNLPVNCRLWTKTPLSHTDVYSLTLIKIFYDDGHYSRALVQCEECGQFYYREYYEEIDWVAGNDPQYYTYIPILPSAATIHALNKLDMFALQSISPRLVSDWLANGHRRVMWLGRTDMQAKREEGKALIKKAAELAHQWHEGAVRKADGTPYFAHPKAVASLLAAHGFADEVVAAAFCHDLLEDTDCPEAEIEAVCGARVLEIVKTVTNDDTLPWKEKKLQYIASVRAGSDDAKALCVADKIHNLRSLLTAYGEQGSAVWAHFNRGKKEKLWFEQSVLHMLQETWEHPLVEEYAGLVKRMERLEG